MLECHNNVYDEAWSCLQSGYNPEDSNHYLLQCSLYFQARNKMLNEI